MRFDGQSSIALLENLALLYLGLAQGADDHLHDAEKQTIAARLRHWQPDKDPALIDHVVRDVMLSYRDEVEQLDEVVASLGQHLSEERRRAVVRDLREIARADGTVIHAEKDFIREVATAWQVPADETPEA